jgi:hypothetical protein
MRAWLVVALAITTGACNTGSLNPAACANHPLGWCPTGTYCVIKGDESKCVPVVDGSSDQIDAISLADRGDRPSLRDTSMGPDRSDSSVAPDTSDGLPSTDKPADSVVEAESGPTDATADAEVGAYCGDGIVESPEQCDQGSANKKDAYGKGLCTTDCKNAPYCGDGIINGVEVCDNGGSGSTDLGACNPECTGYYEKKIIQPTGGQLYSTDLGGPAGADGICQDEFGAGWKALIVGGGRRATLTPFLGDQPQDWVIQKYSYYYNQSGQLLWRTDDIPLLGVHAGMRESIYADVFPSGNYPWTGWAADWTTLPDDDALSEGTCNGWTTGTGWASFAFPNLMPAASEECGSSSFILCAQQ